MRQMKKCLAILMALALLCTLLVVSVAATDTAQPHLGAQASATEVHVGEEFTVTLSMAQMTTCSYAGGITFDKELLEYVNHDPGEYSSPDVTGTFFIVPWFDHDPNGIGISLVNTVEQTFPAAPQMCVITFRAKAAGTASFSLYEQTDGTASPVNNQNYGSFSVTIVDPVCFSVTAADGTEKEITESMLKAADSVTTTAEEPWTNSTNSTYVGTFYSVKSILENAGIDVSDAHGLKAIATDGFVTGISTDSIDDLYIYDQSAVLKDGTAAGASGYGTAINGSAGNKWAKDVASLAVADDHIWFIKKGACKHYCSVCGEAEPAITFTAADGTKTTIYDCMIKAADSVTTTEENAWGYKTNKFVGTFYSLKSILETQGIDVSGIHGIKSVSSDGFSNGFTAEELDNVYIFNQGAVLKNGTAAGDPGTYGTALNGGAGNKWARGVVSIAPVYDHAWFFKDGACKHYCSICSEDEPSITFTAADGSETRIYDCMIKAADSVTTTEEEPWGYKTNKFVGTFYSLKSILETQGIDVSDIHGMKSVSSDGFSNGFTAEELDNVYIFDQGAVLKNGTAAGDPGTYGTAVNGGAGNKWARGVVTVSLVNDHAWFFKDGACKHYCAICSEAEPTEDDAAVAATCTEDGLTAGSHYASCGTVCQAQDTIPALGHSFTSYIYNNDAEIGKDGTETATCDNGCGATDTRTKEGSALVDPNPFTDVDSNAYYYQPVLWAVKNGITVGTSETTFSPDKECTRAQVVTFLWRAAGKPAPTSTNNPFTDVKESDYYYEAVLWAVEQGITVGTSTTTFSPNKPCTRAQVVTFQWRAAGKPEPTTTENPFTDVSSKQYYYNAVLWAVENGITVGTSTTAFSPDKVCNRGQIVTFLYRQAAE